MTEWTSLQIKGWPLPFLKDITDSMRVSVISSLFPKAMRSQNQAESVEYIIVMNAHGIRSIFKWTTMHLGFVYIKQLKDLTLL